MRHSHLRLSPLSLSSAHTRAARLPSTPPHPPARSLGQANKRESIILLFFISYSVIQHRERIQGVTGCLERGARLRYPRSIGPRHYSRQAQKTQAFERFAQNKRYHIRSLLFYIFGAWFLERSSGRLGSFRPFCFFELFFPSSLGRHKAGVCIQHTSRLSRGFWSDPGHTASARMDGTAGLDRGGLPPFFWYPEDRCARLLWPCLGAAGSQVRDGWS